MITYKGYFFNRDRSFTYGKIKDEEVLSVKASNFRAFTVDEISSLLNKVAEKEKELSKKNIEHDSVRLTFEADGRRENSLEYFKVGLRWTEMETEKAYKRDIEKWKKDIDDGKYYSVIA